MSVQRPCSICICAKNVIYYQPPLSAPTQVFSRPCCFPSRSAGREPACTRGGEDRAIGGSQTDCSLALSVMPSAQSVVRCLWLVPLLVEASAFRTRSRTRAPAAATRLPARSARSSAPLAAASAAAEQGFPVVSLPPGFAAPTPRPLRASGDWGGLLLQLMRSHYASVQVVVYRSMLPPNLPPYA
ncbi:hypothetical protein T492DRAFT_173583 [Pavlovales sp. CCMP2436]|nr:hypothetical protein T492DRAFT_173583 [Pavlovales sp. CCMP2436]